MPLTYSWLFSFPCQHCPLGYRLRMDEMATPFNVGIFDNDGLSAQLHDHSPIIINLQAATPTQSVGRSQFGGQMKERPGGCGLHTTAQHGIDWSVCRNRTPSNEISVGS
jgi:hypothetical protein